MAGGRPEQLQGVFRLRHCPEHPGRRQGGGVPGGNEGQGIGQGERLVLNQRLERGVFADQARPGLPDPFGQGGGIAGDQAEIIKETGKGLLPRQQIPVDPLCLLRQGAEGSDLVQQQLFRLQAVVDRIIQLLHLELVVLEQGVIGLLREKQGREKQRIDDFLGERKPGGGPECLQIMPEDIMAAEIFGAADEIQKAGEGGGMIETPIHQADGAQIQNPPVLRADFRIDENDAAHAFSFRFFASGSISLSSGAKNGLCLMKK